MNKPKKILELLSFHMNYINIHWFPGDEKENTSYNLDFDYNISTNETNNLLYRLILSCKLIPTTPKIGCQIETSITGYFNVPEDNDEKTNTFLVCYNGGMMLIGTLRGIIANATGTFPGGKIDLPSIDMKKVMEHVEKKRKLKRPTKKRVFKKSKK